MTPQFVMRASLERHIKGIKPEDVKSRWQTPESQRQMGMIEIENLSYYVGYAEPGYCTTHGDKGILAANWNYFHRGICELLERMGYETEWSDEWALCSDCGKAVRTSPDSYSYQPSYVLLNGEFICLKCVDWSDYLESIEDDPRQCCMAACDPSQHGYTLLSLPGEFENGFHPGQNDNPEKIFKDLQAKGHKNLVFRVPETSQFYIKFEVWQKGPEPPDASDEWE